MYQGMADAVTPDGSDQLHSSILEISGNQARDAQHAIPSCSTTAPHHVLAIGDHLHLDVMTEQPIVVDQIQQVQQYSPERLEHSHEVNRPPTNTSDFSQLQRRLVALSVSEEEIGCSPRIVAPTLVPTDYHELLGHSRRQMNVDEVIRGLINERIHEIFAICGIAHCEESLHSMISHVADHCK